MNSRLERRNFPIDRPPPNSKSLSFKERSNSQKPTKRDEVLDKTKRPPLYLLRREAQTNRVTVRVFTFLLKTKSMRIVLVVTKRTRETNDSIVPFFPLFSSFSVKRFFFRGQKKNNTHEHYISHVVAKRKKKAKKKFFLVEGGGGRGGGEEDE